MKFRAKFDRYEELEAYLRVGQRSLAHLVSKFGVSRYVIHNALTNLKKRGVLSSKPSGEGTAHVYWIAAGRRCSACKVRWVQEEGLCRSCAQAAGIVVPKLIDLEAQRVAARDVSHLKIQRAEIPPLYRVCDGREFEVVFDGRVR